MARVVKTKRSGSRFEAWCKKWLEEQGYIVETAGKKVMRIGNKIWTAGRDFFHAFDILAINQDKIKLIQATLHQGLGKKQKNLERFSWVFKVVDIEIWVRRPDKTIDIYRLTQEKQFAHVGKIMRRKYYELHQTNQI